MSHLKLIKSNKRRSRNAPLYRCPICGGTVTVALKIGGEVVKGKRQGSTRDEVCLSCLLNGDTPYR